MRHAIQSWTDTGFRVRLGFVVLTAGVWGVQAAHRLLAEGEYWNPTSLNDYLTVYLYSASLLLSGASLVILRDVVRPVLARSSVILAVAAACALAGIANALEDGLGLKGFGLPYMLSVVIAGVGMILVAVMLLVSPARRLTLVPALGGLGQMAVVSGGGLVALVAWAALGAWLARERSRLRVQAGT